MNPSFLFHLGAGQEVVKPTYNPAWLNPEDKEFPRVGSGGTGDTERNELLARITQLEAEKAKLEKRLQYVKQVVEMA